MNELNNGIVLTEKSEEEKTVSDSASDIILDETAEKETEQKRINKKTLMLAIAGLLIASIMLFLFFSFWGGVSPEEETTEAETGEYLTDIHGDVVEQKSTSLFDNGLVSVLKDGKWGYMNEAGEIVIDYQFETAGDFNDNGVASVSVDGVYGLIDKNGKFVINPQFDYISDTFMEGYLLIRKGYKYGFIDTAGKVVIDCFYDSATGFRNGYSVVQFGDLYGVINTENKYVINPQYEDLYFAYSEKTGKNIFVARRDDKYGLIDINGKTVVDFQFDYIPWYETSSGFIEDKYAVVSVNDKYGVIDSSGKYLINARYDSLYYCGNDTFVFSDYDVGKDGFVSVDGVEKAAAQFDEVYKEKEGLIRVKLGNYYGFVDYTGTYIINPVFDEANDFCNGYSVVKKDDKYTFINAEGKLMVEYQFDYLTDFNANGYAIVELSDRFGIINNKGEYVLNCQYMHASVPHYAGEPVPADYYCVIDDQKTLKVITADGKIIAQGFDGIAGISYNVCDLDGCYEFVGEHESKYCYNHTFNEIKWFAQKIENEYDLWDSRLSDDELKLTITSECSVDDYSAIYAIQAELEQINEEYTEYFYYYLDNLTPEVLVDEKNHTCQKYVINEYFDLIVDREYAENEDQYEFAVSLEAIRK